jgi:23S rRNA (adenine1618-N6)-methyltransferase
MIKCILKYYFKILYFSIPDNFLIPPVPSRLNYINVINSLLSSFEIKNSNNNRIIGIDIGTGASLIYPILGNSIYNWKFIGSEINHKAYENALKIIKDNKLEENIKIIKQKYKNNIFIGIVNKEEKYTFTMSNPPYYDYKDEIKIEDKYRDCEYNFDEIYYKNGEIGFFERYFEESIYFSKNIFLFSFLIGKKTNAEKIFDKIVNMKDSIKICDMKRIKNGNNIRYIIYWSFSNNYQEFLDVILYSNEYNRFRPIYNSIK